MERLSDKQGPLTSTIKRGPALLKKIAISQLRAGMYIHALDGNWFNHPFWRTRFLLTDPADLQTLRASGIKALWIDVQKGLDVQAPTTAAEQPARPADAPTPTPQAAAAPTTPAPSSDLREELQRASRLLKRSKQQMTGLFNEARGELLRRMQ